MWCIMSPKNLITRFCKDEAASISIEWVVITAGVIALGVGAYGAFSVRPDKFDETEMRTLVRYKMEQYGAIPVMITQSLNACFTVCGFRSLHLKDALVLVSKAARIKTETKSSWDKDLQIIFAVGQTYSLNP